MGFTHCITECYIIRHANIIMLCLTSAVSYYIHQCLGVYIDTFYQIDPSLYISTDGDNSCLYLRNIQDTFAKIQEHWSKASAWWTQKNNSVAGWRTCSKFVISAFLILKVPNLSSTVIFSCLLVFFFQLYLRKRWDVT